MPGWPVPEEISVSRGGKPKAPGLAFLEQKQSQLGILRIVGGASRRLARAYSLLWCDSLKLVHESFRWCQALRDLAHAEG